MASTGDSGFGVRIDGVSRRFGPRRVLSDVTAEVHAGQVLAVAGANGSGKSTLLRIVAGILSPTTGGVRFDTRRGAISPRQARDCIGYVSPDLGLYSELTGVENIEFHAALRGVPLTHDDLAELLQRVGLLGRGRDRVAAYSSGMRHRLRYACALVHRPTLLVLDEPTVMLDTAGVAIVRDLIETHRSMGVTVLATNEPGEVDWGDDAVRLGT